MKLRVKGIAFGTVIRCSVSGRNAHASHMLLRWRMLVFLGLPMVGSVLAI